MRRALALVLALAPGCLWDHCGPTFSHVQGSIDAPFQSTPENRTRIRDAFVLEGFAVDDQYAEINPGLLRLVRGNTSLSVQPLIGSELSAVRFAIDVTDRDFADGEPMDAYSKALERQHQGEWGDVHARLLAAVGLPAAPAPPLQGVAVVC